MPDLRVIQTVLDRAVVEGVFPGAVLAVRRKGEPAATFSAGRLSAVPPGPAVQSSTTYDLASLTKPLVTATAMAILVQGGRCRLDDTVADYLPECVEAPVGTATLRHLLAHSSGLPGWRGFYERLSPDGAIPSSDDDRARAQQAMLQLIGAETLVYERGTRSLYSDLGFMLLGWIIERCSRRTLGDFFQEQIGRPLGRLKMAFVLAERLDQFLDEVGKAGGGVAPTEVDPWRNRLLHGEVHDQNAAALGGEAGHAGLFGTAAAVLAVTGEWLQGYHGRKALLDQEIVREFTRRQRVGETSSWALGWDTPSAPFSSGHHFPGGSFGHLGYTGTSMWIDPEHELEVVLLSNRVHPTSRNDAVREFRPVIHDLVYEEFIGSD
ncbi:MAG TPA: serine hydrolase domain-containing protein [Nitrospira sp.]|nr:serine hydrolase domain-containing protein [Nitrospira sp.]